ncbi:hypothetical protein OCK74_12380 [Chitinophagaceae bacterium LB-8]|uniref:Uncharacterized protein n=1 Tax=Paraflavisolibacter caeni TaxID=2982496 RepID=A0A9X3B809_9BACT|nr:hypothetical protein [Paraflavisolibacter caeni]MCU7549920.1 hypothetical protein [Paraflavisolibacter caeni]
MLQIDITGIDLNGGLVLEVNGHPNNGHSAVQRGWAVHWKVNESCDVDYIEDIQQKDISGTTDIFSSNPPRSQNPQRKTWIGIVNGTAADYSVYAYAIKWVKKGSTDIKTFDPLISVKPTSYGGNLFFLAIGVVSGVLAGFFCFSKKKKKKSWF